jgi:hypothetical protein
MRLSRTAALLLVGMVSLVGLGGVWGTVLVILPHSDYDTVSLAQSMPSQPITPIPDTPPVVAPPVEEDLSLTALPPPDPLPTPPVVERMGGPRAPMAINVEIRCDGEIEMACPDGSVEERRQCMQAKLRQMSAPCRQRAREQLVRMKANLHHMRAACAEDARRFCRDVEAGKDGIVQCLEAHAQEVSDVCFEALPKRGRLLR